MSLEKSTHLVLPLFQLFRNEKELSGFPPINQNKVQEEEVQDLVNRKKVKFEPYGGLVNRALWQFNDSVRNSRRQSANAEVFAEAYLHFIVFASAIKMLRLLKFS